MAAISVLPTTAVRLFLKLCTGGCGSKFLPTMIAAKIEYLSITLGRESG